MSNESSTKNHKHFDFSAQVEDFDKLVDESFDHQLFNADKMHPGALIEGTVLSVTDQDVFLNIGAKAQGIVPVSEFPADAIPKTGDELQLVVVRKSPDTILLSYSKAKEHKTLESLRHAFKSQIPVHALVKEAVPGGFTVEIDKSFKAFVPISQIDTIHVEEADAKNYVGKTLEFVIQTLFRNRHLSPVLSRRQLLTSQVHISREKFFEEKKVGDVVEGTVKNHTSFGVFIDLGGFDGLLHISDMGWDKHGKPSEFAAVGEAITTKIIKIDYENKKINLSRKALLPDPWEQAAGKYQVGTIVKGEVIKILSYGCFVHLEEGIEGFIHVSEMSWTQRVQHPKDVVALHSVVECKVLTVDIEHRRISLGIKQVQKNPWDTIETQYPVGLTLTLPVRKIVRSGMFLEFPEGFTGFVPADEYAWNKKNAAPAKQGDEIEARVIGYKRERSEITLSVRQLSDNPFKHLTPHTAVEGTITSITDFGIFVQLSNGTEGFMPKSLCFDPAEHGSYDEVRGHFKRGDSIQAVIKEVNPKDQKLVLSVRDLKELSSKQDIEKHMVSQDDNHNVFNLGDVFNKKT